MSSQIITPNKKLNKIVTRLRQRWLLQKLAYTLLIGICLGLAAYWMTKWIVWPLAAVTLMMGFAALVFSRSRQYQDITANKVLLHLNRQFSECEESAELVEATYNKNMREYVKHVPIAEVPLVLMQYSSEARMSMNDDKQVTFSFEGEENED